MHRLLCGIAFGTAVLVTPTARDVAQPSFPPYAFFVIGPDTLGVRPWTSEWIALELHARSPLAASRIWGWREYLLAGLDVDPPTSMGPPPFAEFSAGDLSASGVSLERHASANAWPWDMRRPVSLRDLRAIHHIYRMESLAQIVIERQPSGYILTAQVISRADSTSITHVSESGPNLQVVARRLAGHLYRRWVLLHVDSVPRAR